MVQEGDQGILEQLDMQAQATKDRLAKARGIERRDAMSRRRLLRKVAKLGVVVASAVGLGAAGVTLGVIARKRGEEMNRELHAGNLNLARATLKTYDGKSGYLYNGPIPIPREVAVRRTPYGPGSESGQRNLVAEKGKHDEILPGAPFIVEGDRVSDSEWGNLWIVWLREDNFTLRSVSVAAINEDKKVPERYKLSLKKLVPGTFEFTEKGDFNLKTPDGVIPVGLPNLG